MIRIAILLLAVLFALPAAAQTFPAKPLRVIVVYPPGGTSDAVARLLAEKLAPTLGQQVVVENRGGVGGAIGMDAMAKSAPDGHTVAFGAISPLTLLPHVGKVPYDALRDVVPLASVMYAPVYLLATPAFTGKDFAAVVARVTSMSFIAALPPAEFARVVDQVRKLLATHPETKGRSSFELPYRTGVYWCERL